MAKQYGGSFAPPLSPEKIAEYKTKIMEAEPRFRDALLPLVKMVEVFQETPSSSRTDGKPHPSGVGIMVPLEENEIKRIWDHVPWDWECDALQSLFDTLPGDSPLRTPAFHLLWFAKELTDDREPMTTDRI